MVTASHNPKAYTGMKLVREGALALSGDTGIQDIRRLIEEGLARGAGRGQRRGGRHLRRVPGARPLAHRRRDGAARCVVVDGGNGMAGPMVGPLLERLGLDLVDHLLGARRELPRPRAQPAAPREPPVHHRQGPRGGRRPGHRLGRRRRPLLLHRRHRRVRGRRLPHRAAGGLAAAQAGPRDDPLRRARQPRRPRHGGGGRRHRADQPRRPRVLQDAHAGDRRDLRRRGLRPLLLPRLLQRRLGDAPGAAHPRAAVRGGQAAVRAGGALPGALLHLGRDQLRGRRPGRPRCDEIAERYSDGEQGHARRHLDRLPDWHFNVRPSNTEPLLRLNLESLVSREDMERRRDEVLALIRA